MVGSHLAEYLIEKYRLGNYWANKVEGPLDNISSLVEKINNNQRVKLVYGDIRDPLSIDEVIKIINPTILFHLAAQSYPLTSFTSPLDTLETNIQGTTIVLEALRKYSKECITHVCASSEVFGRVTKR